jgi:SM-20-related protein
MNADAIAAALETEGRCVCPDYLNVQELSEIRLDLMNLRARNKFHRAGVGQGRSEDIHDSIRRDEISWLDRDTASAVQTQLWLKLELLRAELNRPPYYLGLTDFEGHYAHYGSEGFYRRHLDAVPRNNTRIVSIVLYLNEHWTAADGGRLRLYDQDGFLDIDPIGGTLVCFLSEKVEHEVCVSYRDRLSFCGWFKKKTMI